MFKNLIDFCHFVFSEMLQVLDLNLLFLMQQNHLIHFNTNSFVSVLLMIYSLHVYYYLFFCLFMAASFGYLSSFYCCLRRFASFRMNLIEQNEYQQLRCLNRIVRHLDWLHDEHLLFWCLCYLYFGLLQDYFNYLWFRESFHVFMDQQENWHKHFIWV